MLMVRFPGEPALCEFRLVSIFRVAERRLKPGCPSVHAHIKRRAATQHSYHPWNRGLKPTATLKGRSATVEHQPALSTKRGTVPRICV
jgi:hypothetical protein